jgi:hypothetical protein
LRRSKKLGKNGRMMSKLIKAGLDFTGRVRCGKSTTYLPVHDHKRLPGRFFARLKQSDSFV